MTKYEAKINHLKEKQVINKEKKKSFIPEDLKKEMEEEINKIEINKGKFPKKHSTPIWDLIKEKVKIPDLVQLENNRCECLQFGNTTSPSCLYYEDSETLHCHKCKKTMDVIEVYAVLNNIERSEAIRKLAKQYDIPFEKVDQERIEIEKKVQYIFIDFMMKCHNNPEFQNKYALIEMKKRGFTKETIENFKIGLFDGSIKKYMNTTYSKDNLQKGGFINKKGNWSFEKRIVYPYLDQNNKPEYFIYRLIDSEPDFNKKAKYIKQIKTMYTKEIPFGLNSIYTLRKKPLIITEGLTDSISAIQANYPVLSPITVRIKKEDIEKMINYCKRFKRILVVNDNEELKRNKDGELENTGLIGAIDTLKVLIKHNINCSIGIIPNPEKLEKIDLDDYLKPDLTNVDDNEINTVIENSLEFLEEKLNELIQQSTSGLDFLINTINEKSSQDDLIEILEILPENDFLTQEDVFKKLAKKRNLTLNTIKRIYKNFQDDEHLRKQKRKDVQSIKTGISLEDLENEILSWDETLKDNEIIYETFNEIKNKSKKDVDKLISLMAKHLKYYNVNELKRIKIACEFDDIVNELHIDLDLETITDEEIKQIALEINTRRTVILDSLFIWFSLNLGIREERIKDALLPYIKETTDFIIEKYPCFILVKTNDIYFYENGVYIKQHKAPNDFLEEIILKEIPYNIKEITGELKINRRIKIIAREIIARTQIAEDDLNFDILNFKNGILFLEDIKNKTWKLRSHDPKYKSIIQFTIPFNPDIKTSKEIKPFFIKQLGVEQFLRLMQLYGTALTGTPWKWKAITFLDGKSGTGKSEYIFKTLETITPQSYISYEPFSNLISSEDDFASGNLFGTLINFHGEIEDKALTHPEGINKLTEEFISVNKKYGFKGKIKNRCSHFYAMNVVPQIPKEERLDVFRRIEYFKIVGDVIPEDERDPDHFKKIIEKNPNELIAMLNEILIGLSEVLNTGTIKSHPILEKREIYRQASLPLLSFIKKWCIRFETYKETKPSETYLIERHYFLQIYNKYRAELNLEKIESLWSLTDEEKKLPNNYKIYRTRKSTEHVYKGIRFNNEAYKHLNINLEQVKEQKIYYPEGIEYGSIKQTKLIDLRKGSDKNNKDIDYSNPERLFKN